jgi:RNA recognition motif-containing protein
MQIYVGNLPAEFTDGDLRSLFEAYGTVVAASIGEEKGYGLVEMQKKSEARAAVDGLRGKDMQGKPLRVKVLKPGDEFHWDHRARRGVSSVKGGIQFRGDGSYRGSGAIRRGGKRGSWALDPFLFINEQTAFNQV